MCPAGKHYRVVKIFLTRGEMESCLRSDIPERGSFSNPARERSQRLRDAFRFNCVVEKSRDRMAGSLDNSFTKTLGAFLAGITGN